jgi:hypothetical protein
MVKKIKFNIKICLHWSNTMLILEMNSLKSKPIKKLAMKHQLMNVLKK